jgi:membrane dipeptidase
MDFVPPEALPPLEAELAGLGYPEDAIAGIMGGNFLRVAQQVWQPPAPAGT